MERPPPLHGHTTWQTRARLP